MMDLMSLPARKQGDRLVLHTRVVSGSGGGPDKTILNSPRFLADRGYPMVCAYMRPPGDPLFRVLEDRARVWNAPLVAIDDRGPFDRSVISSFRALCHDLRPAIWHGHDYKSNVLGWYLHRHFPMRLITTVHGWVKQTWKTPLYYALDRFSLKRYDHVICVSEDLFDRVRSSGVPEQRCTLLHNGIDVDAFDRVHPTRDAKITLGLDPNSIVIGAVGRLSPEKGFDSLIRACAGLDEKVTLCIAGEGDQEPALQRLISELGVGERVRLLGFVENTVALYEAFDIYAMSSLREGLPNVLLEAMAMRVPIVSTAIAGIPDLIDDGRSGLLVPPGSDEALAGALARLVENTTMRTSMAEAARDWVVRNRSFEARMERMKAIYDRCR